MSKRKGLETVSEWAAGRKVGPGSCNDISLILAGYGPPLDTAHMRMKTKRYSVSIEAPERSYLSPDGD